MKLYRAMVVERFRPCSDTRDRPRQSENSHLPRNISVHNGNQSLVLVLFPITKPGFVTQKCAGLCLRRGVTMVVNLLLEVFRRPAPESAGDISASPNVENGSKTSDGTLSRSVWRFGAIALVIAISCIVPESFAQPAKGSIDVPPGSKLLLRVVGRGDQVYGCLNGSWALKAPDAKLLNQGGSVIGRHFAGPTWQLQDGSWVKGKAIATKIAPDANSVPWLLLESVGGTGQLKAVRFIQRTATKGGDAPAVSCSDNATLRVPYSATYSFYETEK